MTDTAQELKNLANALEESKDLSDKNKEAKGLLETTQVQINNASNDLAYLRSEVTKETDSLATLKVKHQDTLKVNGDQLAKLQVEVQKTKDELDNVLKATTKEKGDLEAKHTELDAKLLKFAEAKKTNQALIDEKKGYLEQVKKEEAKLEDR